MNNNKKNLAKYFFNESFQIQLQKNTIWKERKSNHKPKRFTIYTKCKVYSTYYSKCKIIKIEWLIISKETDEYLNFSLK